ncbi:uncharacterized protein Z518_09367 [Rhinocladiella mackenziei CBS 650.93]|uniref:DUF7708 domain-containing protein n=1 Tax=Rhinocladiella mackenziei CBS 650.93 TaxID=1442369 RepID=A0A0D2IEG6_9EURO|nr:uncharacterized protein Z518_09367 [Rhinocladiella mackenziei CBS 650.93]KIX01641.1 hypothetical protein Z518_09367 [Rhinocladiella mackenziei CBS 650.93]
MPSDLTTYCGSQGTVNPDSGPAGRVYWKQYFEHEDLSSTEIRILQEEGAYLSSILQKASPDDARDAWSYEDLQKAVQRSRQAWESKERLGKGKPQKLFHSLMQKFDMHSTLFQIFPSSNTYTSLVAGAATVLVKASVNHSKTIEELSNALDSISDDIGLCNLDSKLIRSQAVQNAIAKLYIAVFLFFGDAIIWYKSSSTAKVMHSLHKDFSERFRKAVNTIRDQAAAVRHAAELGSQAEVRVVRLDVEQLRGELHDARIGLSGELRTLAEYMHWQHGENLKQHEITHEMLRAVRADAGSLSVQNSITSQLESGGKDLPLALPAAPDTSPSMSVEAICELLQQLVSWHLEHSVRGFRTNSVPAQTLFDPQLAQAINKWLCAASQPLLYLEFLPKDQAARIDHAVGRQTARVLMEAKIPAVMFAQGPHHREPDSGDKDSDTDIILAMLSIAKDIMRQLPKDDQQSAPVWSALRKRESPDDVDFATAGHILDAALQAAPANLHIVLLGYPTFWHTNESRIKAFLGIARKVMRGDNSGIRMVIITQRKLHNVLKHLRPEETESVTAFSGNRPVKAPIMVRWARAERP